MDGSIASLVIIPLVVMVSLAGWLVAVYHADSHPRWQAGQPLPGRDRSGRAMLAGSGLPDTQPPGRVTRINGRHQEPRRDGHQPADVMGKPGQYVSGASR
jgi:hypothetical protein